MIPTLRDVPSDGYASVSRGFLSDAVPNAPRTVYDPGRNHQRD